MAANSAVRFLASHWPSRRRYQVLMAVAGCLLLYSIFTVIPPLPVKTTTTRRLSARELLSRPTSKDWNTIPMIIHQTWFPAGSNMSDDAKSWVDTIIGHHPEWEYVLWDDETNELLVRKHFPWFLDAYLALPFEINRADIARNFYMYLFGGMYADVDTEALRPVEPLFAAHSTSLAPHQDTLSSQWTHNLSAVQRAFMGRMARSEDLETLAAVPNGWMASAPGHPFWLLPVLYVLDNPDGDGSVEGLTGPGVLGPLIKEYYNHTAHQSLRRSLCGRIQRLQSSWQLFCHMTDPETQAVREEQITDALVLLPPQQIYPYSWVDDEDAIVCRGSSEPEFDPGKCKQLMNVEAWPSYFITYCTHAW